MWSGIESRWGRDFSPVQTGPGAHPASCKMGTGSFPGEKCGRGMLPTAHPLLVPRSWKITAIPLPTPWATPGLYGNNLPFHKYIYVVENQQHKWENIMPWKNIMLKSDGLQLFTVEWHLILVICIHYIMPCPGSLLYHRRHMLHSEVATNHHK